jgi:4-hydroxyproline epimerase
MIIEGGPELGDGPLPERVAAFRDRFDHIRSGVINEPRGSDVLVGGLLCEPVDADCSAAVIFFNNSGYLKMCGHGTIGMMVTLMHLGRIGVGEHRIETPVGIVTATVHDSNRVSVRNVVSYRYRKAVTVEVDGIGPVTGDIAWGGNWFFLVAEHGQRLQVSDWKQLTEYTERIRHALDAQGITGANGGLIDHVELFAAPEDGVEADSQNFVLCPGGAFDRSPCGTGTSAKMACLYADGKLQPGQLWRQAGIVGSVFEGSVEAANGVCDFQGNPISNAVVPTITGAAWITAEADLLFDSADPWVKGIRL